MNHPRHDDIDLAVGGPERQNAQALCDVVEVRGGILIGSPRQESI